MLLWLISMHVFAGQYCDVRMLHLYFIPPVFNSSSFLFDMLSGICQGMSRQHLHQPCVAGKVSYFSLSLLVQELGVHVHLNQAKRWVRVAVTNAHSLTLNRHWVERISCHIMLHCWVRWTNLEGLLLQSERFGQETC